jgi:hypothetical protein
MLLRLNGAQELGRPTDDQFNKPSLRIGHGAALWWEWPLFAHCSLIEGCLSTRESAIVRHYTFSSEDITLIRRRLSPDMRNGTKRVGNI